MYEGTPPWDIGRPQPAFLGLAEGGELRGRVLDAGCGTGEHTLMAARLGLDATGIDSAPSAIAAAKRKAAERGLTARFLVGSALELAELGEQFDTVLDSGLFHVFDDEQRRLYVKNLRAIMRPGGRYCMLCFSDRQPGEGGPRRVTQQEIRSSFADGWRVDSIEAAPIETNMGPERIAAWLARITRSMGDTLLIRPAAEGDMAAIAAIYGYNVLHGTATFELEPPKVEEMARRRADLVARGFPYFAAELEGEVAGYAYASSYRPRIGYRFTVEDSVYVRPDRKGMGIGRRLLDTLIHACRGAGTKQMVAIIGDSGNTASIRLHAAAGFEHVGVLRNVGRKFDRWIDTVIMQKALGEQS
jgi:L-amino acid N-acyltransferase YncA/ubiquinone/menaquinone biosynthesis C-methylase UbiE